MNSTKRELLTNILVKAMITKGYLDLARMHRNTKNARKKNEKLLFDILKVNQSSEFGRKYHFDSIKSVEEYRNTVPFTTFNDMEPYVIRMIDGGEENLITSLPLVGYAQSSGSVGRRKFVPLTQPEVDVYTRYTVTRMLAVADRYYRKQFGKSLPIGRGMYTAPSFDDVLPNGMLCSNVADVAAKQLGFLYPYILNVPFTKYFNEHEADSKYINFRFGLEDKNTMYIFGIFFKEFTGLLRYLEENWEEIVEDIELGRIGRLGKATPEALAKLNTVIKPNPERAAELRAEFNKGFDETLIKRIWPNMSVVCGIGTSTFTPFAKLFRGYAKDVPFDFSIYGASEGLFAAVDELESGKYLLLVDSCFYEFIPVDDESEILCLDELEVGKEYEIVITNQSGLYRYRCGDVIKVLEYRDECPYVQFAYRKGQLLNLTGEKTTEEHMAAAVKAVSKASGCKIENWTVYADLEHFPYHYVLLLETKDGTDLRTYTDLAEETLKQCNPRYMYFSGLDAFGAMTIENQQPGTHEAWGRKRAETGVAGYQIKPVRILDKPDKMEFFTSRIIKDTADAV